MNEKPNTINDAIERLERVGTSSAKDFKGIIENDFLELKKALETLSPHLSNLKSNIDKELSETKTKAEVKLQENPWLALATVGIFAFIIGLFFGRNQKSE